MLSVHEALSIVLQHAQPRAGEWAALGAGALGQVLAEDVDADLDLPPFDKAMMDGYAIRTGDLNAGAGTVCVVEEITAGAVPKVVLGPGQAARIMTGAPVPGGADAVVMIERTRAIDDGTVAIDDPAIRPGRNILPLGREMRRGETVLRAGTVLRPTELGLLAAVGRAGVKLIPKPSVAVLSTGDELVPPEQVPGPGQIRNSNGPMLMGQVQRAGGAPAYLGIAPDRKEEMAALISRGLASDVLVLSGGVSAGKLDLVPGVLQELGVRAHFHKVEMKPGKPVFFGTHDRPAAAPALVFGLPGNPVGALVAFELFIRPALRRLGGHGDPGPRVVDAVLRDDFAHQSDRPTYHPAHLEIRAEGWIVAPAAWFGSADLRALTAANAFVVLAAGNQNYRAGQRVPVLMTDY